MKIACSDLLESDIVDALTEELTASGVEVELDLIGSMRALDALSKGEVDACIVAVQDGAEKPAYNQVYGFAFQIVTFGVNQRNPLEELEYAQLRNIFKSSGPTETWNDLVDVGRLQDRKINIWAARSPRVIALEIFNSVVLKGSPLKDSIRYDAQTEEELMRMIRNDDAAIILIPNMQASEDVRILAVKEVADGQSYTPTPDNVFYGDYPLRLPFQVIAADDLMEENVSAILRAVYSERVTAALQEAHYMPLPGLEREAVLRQLR